MYESGSMGWVYRITEAIMKLAYLNLLWLLFSMAGLIIFGIFPATAAAFTICRKWIRGDKDIPVFKNFWRSYKKDFFKSNLLGLLILCAGVILYVDYLFLSRGESNLSYILFFPLLTLGIVYLLTVLFLFPVFVHYDTNVFRLLKNACLLALFNPMISFLMLINLIFIAIIMTMLPAVIPFFGISIPAWTTMYLANVTFNKLEEKSKPINGHA